MGTKVIELVKEDPEYRSLMQRQARHHEGNQIEAVTKTEIEEMCGRVKKAIHTIKQKIAREQEGVANRLNVTMMEMLVSEM